MLQVVAVGIDVSNDKDSLRGSPDAATAPISDKGPFRQQMASHRYQPVSETEAINQVSQQVSLWWFRPLCLRCYAFLVILFCQPATMGWTMGAWRKYW